MSEKSQIMDSPKNLTDFMTNLKSKIRGEEPIEVKQKCLNLCQKYLGGNWTQITTNDIEMVRLTGGMSNQVYYCKIIDSKVMDSNHLKEVAVRLYGNLSICESLDNCKVLNETIIGLLVSENGLGPKVYGLFSEGQIQKYYPHKHFNETDLYNKDLLNQLSAKLARYHAMKVPVNKNINFIEEFLIKCRIIVGKILADKHKLFEEYKCKSLLECDLKGELDWVIKNIHNFDSPTQVFSHNDFRFGNLMVTKDKQIVLGDFEASCYYNRGMDFSSLFSVFEKLVGERVEYKDVSIVKEFIRGYIRENEKLFGKQYSDKECNSVENILRETQVFSMIYSLFSTIVMVLNEELVQMPMTEETCFTVADSELAKYLVKKKMLCLPI